MNTAVLRKAREAKEIPRDVLARRVGVSPVTYERWETGKTEPRPKQMARLARALDIELITLFDPEPEEASPAEVAS